MLTSEQLLYIKLEINDKDGYLFSDEEINIYQNKHLKDGVYNINLIIQDLLENILTNKSEWSNYSTGNAENSPPINITKFYKDKIKRLRTIYKMKVSPHYNDYND